MIEEIHHQKYPLSVTPSLTIALFKQWSSMSAIPAIHP